MKYTIIGKVESRFTEQADPEKMRKERSRIIIEDQYREGLYRIEESSHLKVVFYFHLSDSFKLKGRRRDGKSRGVFASRSPNRPTPIGITTVELIKRKDNVLIVDGLDAVDGSPVLDIKPFASSMDLP